MPKTRTHVATDSLEYRDTELVWGEQTVRDIAESIGSTPFYAYSRKRIEARVDEFRAAMPDQLRLHYAMKANPHPDVVRHFATLVDGLDVASAGELEVALGSGADPATISFAGPGKRDFELRAAIQGDVTLNVESASELTRALAIGEELGVRPRIALRVNPEFELKGSGMRMGGYSSQFGIDSEKIPEILNSLDDSRAEFRGFHVYAGSQNLKADAIVESVERTAELVAELAAASPFRIAEVNLGGGIGIPYFPGEQNADLRAIGHGIANAVAELERKLDGPAIVMELGRFLVGEAGIYVTRVLDIKESRGKLFAVCDGGLHHHLAASGNFGQVLRKNYPVVAAKHRERGAITVDVVGPLCTPLDILGSGVEFAGLEVGDLVVVLQSGAYGATASPIGFLSQPGFAEVLV